MGMLDKVQITRRVCPVIFLLDTSGSMDGAPIGAVNDAMENVLPDLIDMNNDNADNEIRIGVLTFNSDVKWITGDSDLVSPEDLKNSWNDLNAYGMTSMGAAFEELKRRLSTKDGGFMRRASGSVAPVLFLLSDGEPTDDYQYGLNKLKENNWYKVAAKVAVGYEDFNYNVLLEFTGNKETVLSAPNPQELKKMIRFIAITSSRVASTGSSSVDDNGNTATSDDNTQNLANALQAQGGTPNLAPMDPGDTF